MAGAAHTRGPWTYRETPHDLDMAFTIEGPSAPVGDVYGTDIAEVSPASVEANARLFAAAPDLLSALQHVLSDTAPANMSPEAHAAAVAALAKATTGDSVGTEASAGVNQTNQDKA